MNPEQSFWQPFVSERVPQNDQTMFNEIKEVVNQLPKIDFEGDKKIMSCHMLAEAISQNFSVELHHGYFSKRGFEHSWLETKNSIIDVYPIAAIGGPILFDKISLWEELYINSELPQNSFGNKYSENVNKISQAIKEILSK